MLVLKVYVQIFFRNSLGLMQGEVLSPILFSLFINDFEMQFIKDGCVPVELQDIHLFILMYADDMVSFPLIFRDFSAKQTSKMPKL